MITLVVVRKDTFCHNRLAALFHKADLLRHVTEPADDLLVSIIESEDGVRNTSLLAELQNILLSATQVVAGHARVQVVDSLKLQATVEEVQPGRTVNIHSRSEHLLGERFVNTHISSRHGKMGERDLDVQRRGYDVRNQQVDESALPVGDRLVHYTVDEPIPKKSLTSELKPHMPPGGSFSRGLTLQ